MRIFKLGYVSGLTCLFLTAAGWSQSWDKPPLLFSHVEHPQIELLKPILRQAYASLNIPIEFVAIPAERELRAADRGEVDGITGRTGFVEAELENALRIPVSLLDINVYLICRMGVYCDQRMLNEPEVTIAIPSGQSIALLIMKGRQAQVLPMTTNNQLLELTVLGRIDYALFAVAASNEELLSHNRVQVSSPRILQTGVYHYLHHKHRALLPMVEQALRQVMASRSEATGNGQAKRHPSSEHPQFLPAH